MLDRTVSFVAKIAILSLNFSIITSGVGLYVSPETLALLEYRGPDLDKSSYKIG